MFPSQSNTIPGPTQVKAGADLTGLEGRLIVLGNSAGVLVANLPASLLDIPTHVLVDGGAAGTKVTVLPLVGSEQARVRINGTANPGDQLVLEDPVAAAGVNAGKVRAIPGAAGAYVRVGISEEIAVDEQLVLLRPALGLARVKSADTITGAADLAKSSLNSLRNLKSFHHVSSSKHQLQSDSPNVRTGRGAEFGEDGRGLPRAHRSSSGRNRPFQEIHREASVSSAANAPLAERSRHTYRF
jgi:hypothetical protein